MYKQKRLLLLQLSPLLSIRTLPSCRVSFSIGKIEGDVLFKIKDVSGIWTTFHWKYFNLKRWKESGCWADRNILLQGPVQRVQKDTASIFYPRRFSETEEWWRKRKVSKKNMILIRHEEFDNAKDGEVKMRSSFQQRISFSMYGRVSENLQCVYFLVSRCLKCKL